MSEPFSFLLVTDPHYFENALGAEGEAYEKRSVTDQKCVAETGAIIDAEFERIAQNPTQTILIPGDMVYRSETASHVGFIKKLNVLKEKGKKIYVITARHDCCDEARGFIGAEEIPVDKTERKDLRELYYEFGFQDAIATWEKDGLSYVAQLAPGIRLLALNCDGDCGSFKGLWDDQMDWALAQIKAAQDAGEYIFAMTHYPLLPGSAVMNLIEDAKLTDWEKRAQQFADAGLKLMFTGHMHMQSLTQYTTENGNTITDICTGSLVGCPAYYRHVTIDLDEKKVDIDSIATGEFAFRDKGSRTAAEYFQWRFDRMIVGSIDNVLSGIKTFGPFLQKKLHKWTVGDVGRLLCIKVDPVLKNRMLLDVAVELVRNIFVGNEPYVKGTPVYEVLERFFKRFRPILHIVEKKLGANNPLLADIPGFVLSMIGDEKQMDYQATLPL